MSTKLLATEIAYSDGQIHPVGDVCIPTSSITYIRIMTNYYRVYFTGMHSIDIVDRKGWKLVKNYVESMH